MLGGLSLSNAIRRDNEINAKGASRGPVAVGGGISLSSTSRPDSRQDEHNNNRGERMNDFRDKIDVSEVVSKACTHGDVGFEVEMQLPTYSNSDADDASSCSSSKIPSAFSFSQVSDSSGTMIKTTAPKAEIVGSSVSMSSSSSRLNLSETTKSATLSKKGCLKPSLYIDLASKQTNEVVDATPKTHNRSIPPKQKEKWNAKFLSLGKSSKHDIEKERSTIVQNVETPTKETNKAIIISSENRTEKHASTVTQKNEGWSSSLPDSNQSSSSSVVHTSLMDSGLTKSMNNEPCSLQVVDPRWESIYDKLMNDTDSTSERVASPFSQPNLDSQAHDNIVQENESHDCLNNTNDDVNRQLFQPEIFSELENVDNQWETMREKLLAVDTCSSNTSMSVNMEEILIQDCVATGLPSPTKSTNEFLSQIPTPATTRRSRCTSPGDQKVVRHKADKLMTISSPELFPSKIPSATKASIDMHSRNEEAKKDIHNLKIQNKCLQETEIGTIPSGLTVETDKVEPAISTTSSISVDEANILRNFSSCSCDSKDMDAAGPTDLLKNVLSSASESCYDSPDRHQAEEDFLTAPERTLKLSDETLRVPKTELALESSSSGKSVPDTNNNCTDIDATRSKDSSQDKKEVAATKSFKYSSFPDDPVPSDEYPDDEFSLKGGKKEDEKRKRDQSEAQKPQSEQTTNSEPPLHQTKAEQENFQYNKEHHEQEWSDKNAEESKGEGIAAGYQGIHVDQIRKHDNADGGKIEETKEEHQVNELLKARRSTDDEPKSDLPEADPKEEDTVAGYGIHVNKIGKHESVNGGEIEEIKEEDQQTNELPMTRRSAEETKKGHQVNELLKARRSTDDEPKSNLPEADPKEEDTVAGYGIHVNKIGKHESVNGGGIEEIKEEDQQTNELPMTRRSADDEPKSDLLRAELEQIPNWHSEERGMKEQIGGNIQTASNENEASTLASDEESVVSQRGDKNSTTIFDSNEGAPNYQKTQPAATDATASPTKVIITGRKQAMKKASMAKGGGEDNQKEKSIIDDGCEGEADIMTASSTLTGDLSKDDRRTARPMKMGLAPVLHKSSKIDHSVDLSVGLKDTNSFDTRLSASNAGVPSWRMEPSESLADFTIQILHESSRVIDTYHVHKHMLAVGPRRSEYLDEVFRSSTLSSTQLTLEDKAATLFPFLLDFMYCQDVEVHVTTDTAVAYRNVAATFKVIPLLVKVAGFLLEDLRIENMSTYITESSRYQDHKIMNVIVTKCTQKIKKIDISDPLWAVLEPGSFFGILSSLAFERKKLSAHLSLLVVEYQRLHKDELDAKMFGMLSSEEILPLIDREAALPLLEICEAYGSSMEFQPLQKRCADVMASYWRMISEEDRQKLFALLRSLPSTFTVDFLELVETGKSKSGATTKVLKESSKPEDEKNREMSEKRDPENIASISIGSLCDDLAGEDGYSVSNTDNSPLSWRMDPIMSYSDWTIRVKYNEFEHQGDSYHIHKHIISIGPYKSYFFADLFLSEEEGMARRGVTTIELAHEAAAVFPQMLDFIYSPVHQLSVSKENAVALRFLARVFGVWMLNKQVMEFVKGDLSFCNILTYIEQSETFDDSNIAGFAARFCAKYIKSIDVESPLLRAFKPGFFGQIVSADEIDRSASCHVSILIAKYFTLHDLDESLLAQLLKESNVTEIDSSSAMDLLTILIGMKSTEFDVFNALRSRCASVLTENWSDLREEYRDRMFTIFRDLEPELLADVFDKVESDYYEQHYLTMSLQCKLVKRYRSQLAEAKKEREEEVAKLKKELEEKTAEMKATQRQLEAKLRQHSDASTRRAGRSSAVFPSPHTRKSKIPTPGKSSIPRGTTPSPSKKMPITPTSKAKITITVNSKEPSLKEAIESKEGQHPESQTEQPSFLFNMFRCSTPPVPPSQLPDAQGYVSKMAASWSHN